MFMDLRQEIRALVAQAIDGTTNYSGTNVEQNKSNWGEIVTDRIIGAVFRRLPPPVQLEQKYEMNPEKGLYVRIGDDMSDKANEEQLIYVSNFADDKGYNRYHSDMVDMLMNPYGTLMQPGEFATISKEGESNGKSR